MKPLTSLVDDLNRWHSATDIPKPEISKSSGGHGRLNGHTHEFQSGGEFVCLHGTAEAKISWIKKAHFWTCLKSSQHLLLISQSNSFLKTHLNCIGSIQIPKLNFNLGNIVRIPFQCVFTLTKPQYLFFLKKQTNMFYCFPMKPVEFIHISINVSRFK